MPYTLQSLMVSWIGLAVPETVEVNCWPPFKPTVALAGETDTVTLETFTVMFNGSLLMAPGAGWETTSFAVPAMEAGTLPVTLSLVGET